jgi:hypothetical protein
VCLVVDWNLLCGILWGVVCICNYMFDCRLEFKNVVLREILGGEMCNAYPKKGGGGWTSSKSYSDRHYSENYQKLLRQF